MVNLCHPKDLLWCIECDPHSFDKKQSETVPKLSHHWQDTVVVAWISALARRSPPGDCVINHSAQHVLQLGRELDSHPLERQPVLRKMLQYPECFSNDRNIHNYYDNVFIHFETFRNAIEIKRSVFTLVVTSDHSVFIVQTLRYRKVCLNGRGWSGRRCLRRKAHLDGLFPANLFLAHWRGRQHQNLCKFKCFWNLEND